jgi:hypothetical protein
MESQKTHFASCSFVKTLRHTTKSPLHCTICGCQWTKWLIDCIFAMREFFLCFGWCVIVRSRKNRGHNSRSLWGVIVSFRNHFVRLAASNRVMCSWCVLQHTHEAALIRDVPRKRDTKCACSDSFSSYSRVLNSYNCLIFISRSFPQVQVTSLYSRKNRCVDLNLFFISMSCHRLCETLPTIQSRCVVSSL